MAREGAKVVLVRLETSPDDFHGMVAAQAIVTARGGMTSHAAVVARGMGKTCVCGANAIERRLQPATIHGRRQGRHEGRMDHCRRINRPCLSRPGADDSTNAGTDFTS